MQEEQRVELAGVPDHALTRDEAEQGDQRELGVPPLAEGLGQRRLGGLAFVLHLLEGRRFGELQTDPDGDAEQQDRDQERDAPAPFGEGRLAGEAACRQDDEQRQEQAQRRGGLDPARIEAAPAVGRVLRHVGRGTAVLAAEGEPCARRRTIRMIGAAMPMVAALGRTPTMNVDRPMIRIVIRKVYLRPTRSPMRPKTRAPNGRTMNPAAKASRAKMSRVAGG